MLRVVLDSLHPYDAIKVLSEAHVNRALEGIDETLVINTGTRYANMRIQAAQKEPWTYQWIRNAIARGDVLYDIGANVGGYTLIALARGAQVVAFEPHHENYRELCRNVSLNKLEDRATLIPAALSDRRGALRNPTFGGAAGQSMTLEGADSGPVSIIADRLDDLGRDLALPAPNHIKIDVDGFELKVLHGGEETFAAPELRTSLVEIDLEGAEPGPGPSRRRVPLLRRTGLQDVRRDQSHGRGRELSARGARAFAAQGSARSVRHRAESATERS